MYFDHQHFPLVWMRRAEGAGQPVVDPYQQLEALTQRAQAFVLMSDLIPEPEQRNSAQGKALLKQGSMWTKCNKAAIRRWIKAMIVIAPQPENQAQVEAFARNYEQFWGYPLLHSASPLAAISLAQQLLAPPRSNLNNW